MQKQEVQIILTLEVDTDKSKKDIEMFFHEMEDKKEYEWIEWCGCNDCAGCNDDCGDSDECVTSKKVEKTD